MNYPLFEINLGKITANTRAVVELCASHNITVTGVVKSTCGSPEIARAFLEGGIQQLGDSRIANFDRLHDNGVNAEFMMLRIPMLSQCAQIASLCDYSLNSELPVIAQLGKEANKIDRVHKVILMIDLGDLREGVLPTDAPFVAEQVCDIQGVELVGIGTNLTCYGGVKPTEKNLGILADCAENIEQRLGRKLQIVSGGNSSSMQLVMSGKMPPRINHLRIGEAILLGQETLECKPLPGTVRDAFIFKAEVIEAGRKPSAPMGEIVRDAFGNKPDFENKGIRRRAILGAGRQDIVPGALKELVDGVEILGASSDHLLLDVENCKQPVYTGDIMSFRVEYAALLGAMTSIYVNKEFLGAKATLRDSGIQLIYAPNSTGANMPGTERAPEVLEGTGLVNAMQGIDLKLYKTINAFDKKYIYDSQKSLDAKVAEANNLNSKLALECYEALKAGNIPLTIGGDHSSTVGAASGLLKFSPNQEKGLIIFGAFANFNTLKSTESGNLHGLTLAGCTKYDSSLHVDGIGVFPQENVVLIGVRELDSQERRLLRESRINIFTMEKIDYLGLKETMNQAISCLRHCSGGVHTSISLDVLSPEYAPGVSIPVEGGLNLREAHLAMEMLYKSQITSSIDLVEFNPDKDNDNISAQRAISLVCTLLGKSII